MIENIEVELNGINFTWNGKIWFETKSRGIVPTSIKGKLNNLIAVKLKEKDDEISNIDSLLKNAVMAKDANQLPRAIELLRHALHIEPSNLKALTILCATLRKQDKSEQALKETNAYKDKNDPFLLTSRAAALCDIEKWEEAKKEIGHALAILKDGAKSEAFLVVSRIKVERPDLYE